MLLQMEAVECGAAALGIILGYHDRIVPLAELRQACGVSRDGSSAANIVRAAQRYGLVARGFKQELDTVQQLPCPYIVFWNFNHFVVLEGWGKRRVYLNDPATGHRSVSFEEFDASFTGVVLVMEPGPDFMPGGRRSSLLLALRERLHDSSGALIYCWLAGLLLVFPSLLTPILTQLFVDHVLIQALHDWLRPLLLGMLLAAALRGMLLRLQLRQLRRLKLKLATSLSSQFLWHVLHLPTSFFAQRFAGEISQRMALNDKVAEVLSGRLVTTAIDLLTLLFYAVFMAYYDLVLTAIGLGSAAVNMIALHSMARRRVDTNMRVLHDYGKLGGVAIAGLQNIETLKASALESGFFTRWAGHYAHATDTQQTLAVTNQTLSVLPTLLSALTTMLVLVVGGLRVMQGHLSIGMLVAFQSMMQQFLSPVSTLVHMGSTLQELQGDVHRLDDVLHHPTLPSWSPAAVDASVSVDTFRWPGRIEVRHLTFGYSPVAPPLIEDLSFSLRPGQRVALVGASGSGKSTVAKLFCGLYEPWSGEIEIDGMPRAQVPPGVLPQVMSFVDQDIVLFAGTVRDNLTLWDDTVPTAHLIQACKDAAIHDTVVSWPGGYDHELSEGAANISGGQRQRLEIARALVQRPAILVMDEATSALDAETEQIIMQNLQRRACACLVVAHRLSTIRDCDEIIVLDRGQMVQRGQHEELLREGGIYSRLLLGEGDVLHESSSHDRRMESYGT
jgi:NHLM bacteriocin system ABC transporter peptidase/ATP-binding protein